MKKKTTEKNDDSIKLNIKHISIEGKKSIEKKGLVGRAGVDDMKDTLFMSDHYFLYAIFEKAIVDERVLEIDVHVKGTDTDDSIENMIGRVIEHEHEQPNKQHTKTSHDEL